MEVQLFSLSHSGDPRPPIISRLLGVPPCLTGAHYRHLVDWDRLLFLYKAAFTNTNRQKPFGTRLKRLFIFSSIEKLFCVCVRARVCVFARAALRWCHTQCVTDGGRHSFCIGTHTRVS